MYIIDERFKVEHFTVMFGYRIVWGEGQVVIAKLPLSSVVLDIK